MAYKNRDKQREYQKVWIRKRRELFFRGKQCAKCGDDEFLELDHINPDEKWSHRIWSYSWENIMKEAAKCQVLCTVCHDEKTKEDMGWIQEHGTVTSYKNYYCRCDLCKAANNEANNIWRWENGMRRMSATSAQKDYAKEYLEKKRKDMKPQRLELAVA